MDVFENMEGSLEIKRRSPEAGTTQNGKKKRVAHWLLVRNKQTNMKIKTPIDRIRAIIRICPLIRDT